MSNEKDALQDSPAALYFCRKCNSSSREVLEPHPNDPSRLKSVVRLFNSSVGVFTGRKLECKHFVKYSDSEIPDPTSPKNFSFTIGQIISEDELKAIRQETMLEINKMSPEELQIHIVNHTELYKLHLKAGQKEKYVLQLVDMERERRFKEGKITKEQNADFKYLSKSMTKRECIEGENIIKEKVKAERKVSDTKRKTNSSIAKMEELLAKSGKTFDLSEVKKRLGV